LTREEDLRQVWGYWLSDHVGICVDFNLEAPHCNPVTALVPPLDTLVQGLIRWPGSMQWYRIDQKGTYLLATVGAGIKYSVYEQLDLTTPASSYYEETGDIEVPGLKPIEGAGKYCLPSPPFYIRVFHESREQTATYKLIAHRANAASKDDAVALLPSDDLYEYVMPAYTALNDQDTAWFEFHIENSTTGQPQKLRFRIVGFLSPDNADIEVRADDGTTVLASATTPEADPDAPLDWPNRKRIAIEITDKDLPAGRYYLCVKRQSIDPQSIEPLGFFIGWDTDLTALHGQSVPGAGPMMMYCVTETDAGISDRDEIYLSVVADDVKIVDEYYMGQFDDEYPASFEGVIPPLRFVSYVKITLRDSDGGAYGDDDFFYYNIGALPRNQREAFGQAQSTTDEDAAGEYIVSYNLSRTLLKDP
jgi:hypothetical protein